MTSSQIGNWTERSSLTFFQPVSHIESVVMLLKFSLQNCSFPWKWNRYFQQNAPGKHPFDRPYRILGCPCPWLSSKIYPISSLFHRNQGLLFASSRRRRPTCLVRMNSLGAGTSSSSGGPPTRRIIVIKQKQSLLLGTLKKLYENWDSVAVDNRAVCSPNLGKLLLTRKNCCITAFSTYFLNS